MTCFLLNPKECLFTEASYNLFLTQFAIVSTTCSPCSATELQFFCKARWQERFFPGTTPILERVYTKHSSVFLCPGNLLFLCLLPFFPYDVLSLCRFVPPAVLCLLPFCASAVLCFWRFELLKFSWSAVLSLCHFMKCRLVCVSYESWTIVREVVTSSAYTCAT